MKWRMMMFCLLACLLSGFVGASRVRPKDRDGFSTYLRNRAFLQSFSAEEWLCANYHPCDPSAPDEMQEERETFNLGMRAVYVLLKMEEDGIKEPKRLIVDCKQAEAYEAYKYYRDRAAPDKALYMLSLGVFYHEPSEPLNEELYRTFSRSLEYGRLENGFPCVENKTMAYLLYLDLVDAGATLELREYADLQWRNGNKEEATALFNRLKAKAEKGDIEAIHLIVQAYLEGSCCERDNAEIYKWTKKGAELGDEKLVDFLSLLDEEHVNDNNETGTTE